MPERPSWLTEAITGRANTATASPIDQLANPAPGQIRRLEHMDPGVAETRLVLVTDIDTVQCYATVTVLSPETDMGSSLDRIITQQASGLQYDLIALTDVAGPAWLVQLGPVLAILSTELSDLPTAGVPLRDDKDARWQWKEAELDTLVALTAECRYQLLDGEPSTVADPLAFDLNRVGLLERTAIVHATFQLARNHRVLIPAEALAEHVVPMNHQASETFEALLLTAQQNRDLLLPFSSVIAVGEAISLRDLDHDPLGAILVAVARQVSGSVRCLRIASVSSLWRDEHSAPEPLFWSVELDGRRHQVVVTEVEALGAACA